jgi:hypothetical protein
MQQLGNPNFMPNLLTIIATADLEHACRRARAIGILLENGLMRNLCRTQILDWLVTGQLLIRGLIVIIKNNCASARKGHCMYPAVIFGAILGQEHNNGNRISYIEHVPCDSRTVKKACRVGFSGPLFNVAILVFRVEVKVTVRIDPVNLRDHTRHC